MLAHVIWPDFPASRAVVCGLAKNRTDDLNSSFTSSNTSPLRPHPSCSPLASPARLSALALQSCEPPSKGEATLRPSLTRHATIPSPHLPALVADQTQIKLSMSLPHQVRN